MNTKNTLTALALAGAMTLGATAVQAQSPLPTDRTWFNYEYYAEIAVGGPIDNDYDVVVNVVNPAVYDPDGGFAIAGALGAYVLPNVRAEVALNYATGGDGTLTGFGPHAGDIDVFTVLFNGYYEFDEYGFAGDADLTLTPWVGAGLGFQTFDYDNLGLINGMFTISDSDTVFAGALHAGVDIAITPTVDLVGRYSLAFVESHDVVGNNGTPVAVDSTVENVFFGGLRLKLNPTR
ncbi:MAG: outer membrane beta-barrel protein [Pseudomonadota bacterium]